ncbi:MAG: hypothetical protein ACREUY_06095, partial [Burkholderiales bacterium]
MSIARVALDVPLDRLFDYLAPDLTREHIGLRVLVPFGKKQMVGVVVDIAEKSSLAPHRLKRIVSVFHDIPPLGAQILDVFKFCSAYYHHPLGQVMINALPVRLRRSRPITRKTFGAFCLTETGRKLGSAALPAKAAVKRRLLERLKNGVLKKEDLSRISPGAA